MKQKKILCLALAAALIFITGCSKTEELSPEVPEMPSSESSSVFEASESLFGGFTEKPVSFEPGSASGLVEIPDRNPEASSGKTETESGNYDYVLNKNTGKFHYADCESVDAMNESNKIFHSGTRDEAVAMGFVPCENCNP